jgi:hypothetical protein
MNPAFLTFNFNVMPRARPLATRRAPTPRTTERSTLTRSNAAARSAARRISDERQQRHNPVRVKDKKAKLLRVPVRALEEMLNVVSRQEQ